MTAVATPQRSPVGELRSPVRAGFSRSRGAFTLLELLLVLAILTAVLAIGFPSLRSMLDRAEFKAAVVAVQSELYQTRLDAMRTGTALIFRFQNGTGFYEITTKDDYDREKADEQRAEQFAGTLSASPSSRTGATPTLSQKQLPVDIIFQGEPESRTIIFYPNGRVSRALFTLRGTGDRQWYGEISLREITGVPRIDRIGVQADLPSFERPASDGSASEESASEESLSGAVPLVGGKSP